MNAESHCQISLSVSTLGILVIPPTRITSEMSLLPTSASLMAFSQGVTVLCTSSETRLSNLERVSWRFMCLGPDASIVRNGRLISVYLEILVPSHCTYNTVRWLHYLHWRWQLDFCFLCSLSYPLNSHGVWRDINSLLDIIQVCGKKREKAEKVKKKMYWQPQGRFELPTPGLQDQCSNPWATEAWHTHSREVTYVSLELSDEMLDEGVVKVFTT